jgi:hypothetical protein
MYYFFLADNCIIINNHITKVQAAFKGRQINIKYVNSFF